MLPVLFDEGEGGDEDSVVDGDEGFGFKGVEEEVGGFAFVAGEEPLVEARIRRDSRRVAEEHGKKFERGDVAAHDDEADGERYGENQADRSPDECPEGSGDEDGDRGESGVAAVDVGLEVVGGDDFEYDEDSEDEEGVFPAVKDGNGEQRGREGGDWGSDVGNEAAQGGEGSEEKGVGESDEVESDADDGAVGDVDGELEEEVAGDALGGVAHGLRHKGEVAVAGEADEAVAEIFALEEYEKREDDCKERRGEGFDDAAELVETACGAADFADLEGVFRAGADGLLGGLAGGLESRGSGGVHDAEFVADLFEFALEMSEGGVAGAVEGVELEGDVVAVCGEVVGDGDELGEDGPRGQDEKRGERKDDEQCGGRPRKTEALEKRDDRGENEGEEDGDSERKEKDFGEIEYGYGKYGNGDEPKLRQKTCSR